MSPEVHPLLDVDVERLAALVRVSQEPICLAWAALRPGVVEQSDAVAPYKPDAVRSAARSCAVEEPEDAVERPEALQRSDSASSAQP